MSGRELVLERKNQHDGTPRVGAIQEAARADRKRGRA